MSFTEENNESVLRKNKSHHHQYVLTKTKIHLFLDHHKPTRQSLKLYMKFIRYGLKLPECNAAKRQHIVVLAS